MTITNNLYQLFRNLLVNNLCHLSPNTQKKPLPPIFKVTMSMQRKGATNNNHNKNKHSQKNKSSQKNKLPPWVRKLMIPEKKCPDCRGGGDIIDDPKSGRKICTSCGLVLENSLISEQSEWRTFADGDKSGPDPNRVGAAQHYLLQESGDLSTTIGSGGNDKLSNAMKSIGGNVSSSKLGRGIRDISSYCSRLNLPKDVQNFAG